MSSLIRTVCNNVLQIRSFSESGFAIRSSGVWDEIALLPNVPTSQSHDILPPTMPLRALPAAIAWQWLQVMISFGPLGLPIGNHVEFSVLFLTLLLASPPIREFAAVVVLFACPSCSLLHCTLHVTQPILSRCVGLCCR